MHSWEPELNQQGAAWCGEGSPRPLKVLHITFSHAGLPFDQAATVEQMVYYLSVLKVRRAINDKWPELDSAGPHRKREVLETLDSWSWE